MKICFFLTSRYPTSKAYGVTTGESARALRELGHKILIIAPSPSTSSKGSDDYESEVFQIYSKKLFLLREKLDNIKYIGPINFIITSTFYSLKAKSSLKEFTPDVVWVRDALSTLTLLSKFENLPVIVEVHQPPSILTRIAINRLAKKRTTVLLVIQESYRAKLQKLFPKCKVIYAPMGVNNEFLRVGEIKLKNVSHMQQVNPLRVCYVGRMYSSGVNNGLNQLLESWSQIPGAIAKLTLVGLSQQEIKLLKVVTQVENLDFIESIKHTDVPKLLQEFDCGIIPYPSSVYNNSRFPIKLVEYSAAGLNVALTRIKSHIDILDEQIGYFYEVENPYDLLRCISEIKLNRDVAISKAKSGFQWAQRYTYKARVKPIIESVKGLHF